MDFYHVMNRGVEKRPIFLGDGDYFRFINNLSEFNDASPAINTGLYFRKNLGPARGALAAAPLPQKPKKKIVDIHGWVLMKNHFHLLLSEKVDGGISKFLRKLNIGYAKYFNEKYQRSGTLFQGRTKKVLIARDAHLLHILNYIHLNPLDYLSGAHEWRSRQIQGSGRALAHLEKYRWSSYLDYAGTPNFPSMLTTSFFKDVFRDYESEIKSYLRDIDIASLGSLTLE